VEVLEQNFTSDFFPYTNRVIRQHYDHLISISLHQHTVPPTHCLMNNMIEKFLNLSVIYKKKINMTICFK